MKKIVITESQYDRLLKTEDDVINHQLVEGKVKVLYPKKHAKNNNRGWLSYTGEKDSNPWLFGGEPFHMSYFCPYYTGIDDWEKHSLDSTELENFRDNIFGLAGRPSPNVGGAAWRRKINGGIDKYINYIKNDKAVFASWESKYKNRAIYQLKVLNRKMVMPKSMCPYYNVSDVLKNLPSDIGEWVYNIFDCGELKGGDYGHCLLDNASMAASSAPGIGTIVSAVFDLVNAFWYVGDAFVDAWNGEWLEAGSDVLGAGFSVLGIIPGITEADIILKIGKKSIGAGNKVMKEMIELGVDNVSPDKMKDLIAKHSKGLNEKQVKGVVIYFDAINGLKKQLPNVEKFKKELEELIKKNGWTNRQMVELASTKDFKKWLRQNDNDILKALKSWGKYKTARIVKYQVGAFIGLGAAVKFVVGPIIDWWRDSTPEEKESLIDKGLVEFEIIENEGEDFLNTLYSFFGVFGYDEFNNKGCGVIENYTLEEYISNKEIQKCPKRKAALWAYKQGLVLAKVDVNFETCVCEYITSKSQWGIVKRAYKKFLKSAYESVAMYEDMCVTDIESVCSGGSHIELGGVEINTKKD
jgi:hypothetical protein